MNKTIIILILSLLITVAAAACGEQEITLGEVSTQDAAEDVPAEAENTASVDPDGVMGTTNAAAMPEEAAETVCVYICGEVNTPGVYALSQGARIYEAVALAGGLTEDADDAVINQAEPVTDGMMIRIPAVGSDEAAEAAEALAAGYTVATDGTALVNINTADAAALTTLPGIGESKAAAIIAYRQENGAFASIEDLRNVSGIGDSTYERLSPLITVTP